MNARVILLLSFLLRVSAAAQTPFWDRMHGPDGGSIYSVAVSPSNHLFAGVWGSHETDVYRSTNGGKNWSATNNYPATFIAANAMAIDREGFIYAGSSINGAGVFRSTDDGESWLSVNHGMTWSVVQCLAISPGGDLFAGINFGGIYHSSDNGDNWFPDSVGLTGRNVFAIAIDSHSHLFAATFDSGMFRSTDAGSSWSRIVTGIEGANTIAVTVCSNDDVIIGAYDGRIFHSTNDGTNWSELTNGAPPSITNYLLAGANGTVFATTYGAGVYRSTDYGNSWSAKNAGMPYRETLTLAIDSSGVVLLGTQGGGIFTSTNNGESWALSSNGLASLGVSSVQYNSTGTVFAAAYYDAGIFKSADDGENWTLISNGLSATSVHALAVTAGDVLLIVAGNTPYRSTDDGETWTTMLDSLYVLPEKFVTFANGDVLAIAPIVLGAILFRSTDDGLSWHDVFGGGRIGSATENVFGDIFVDTTPYEFPTTTTIHRSTDGGVTWASNDLGYVWHISDLSVNSLGDIFAGGDQGILRSTDDGNGWKKIDSTHTPGDIAINQKDDIFITQYLNVSRSTDFGASWVSCSSGLPSGITPSSLAFDPIGRIIATSSSGLFRSKESTLDAFPGSRPQLPSSVELFQNYPNPFNPATVIRYNLPRRMFVTLNVCNILGEEVARLVDDQLDAGYHSVRFTGDGLASGLYLCHLHAGNFTVTIKMMIVR